MSKMILPTNLPAIEAGEKRADNIYELEDGSIAVIDYESKYSIRNIPKYLSYITRLLAKCFEEGRTDIKIRLIVIYTADVNPKDSRDNYSNFFGTLNIQSAYLSALDSEKIRQKLMDKVNKGERLSDDELMEFIILPLTYKTKEGKREAIRECIDLAKDVKDPEQSIFIIAGIVVFADKIIDQETATKAKEWIDMTQVGRIYQREREQAEELADARRLVESVEAAANGFGVSVQEACQTMRISSIDYDRAKKVLAASQVLITV